MSVRRVYQAGAVTALALTAFLAVPLETARAQDAEAGAQVFRRCAACHTTEEGGPNRNGPNLFGVIGSTSAARDNGFNYSSALREAALEWNDDNLDQWLTKPKAFAPGTKMSFGGFKKPGDRAAVIASLISLGGAPAALSGTE